MKTRTGEPWMPAPAFAHTLSGMGVNLIVRDVGRALAFQRGVLGVEAVYHDPDFAVLRHGAATWMLHADHTYGAHPLLALTGDGALRGAGIELRLYELDPDGCEARARANGHDVLAPTSDRPHGLRECHLVDPDGYVWVPSRRLAVGG
jgi:catechol 2,3-dioxygenase-like lactoylglutathione lyase family enzyme